jgi:hypothetical protein
MFLDDCGKVGVALVDFLWPALNRNYNPADQLDFDAIYARRNAMAQEV